MKQKFKVGDKVYVIDRINIFGREFLVIEPGVIEEDHIRDEDFRGDYLIRLDHNNQSIGDYTGNLIPQKH